MDEMVLQRISSEQFVNDEALKHVINEKVNHLVEYNEGDQWTVIAVLLFDPPDFTVHLIHVGVHQFFGSEVVHGLVDSSEEWVLGSCHLLVVTLHMYVFEMEVEYLGK